MIKQVLVIRTKYPDGKGGTTKIRTGKLIAQAAHASMKVFFDRTHKHVREILVGDGRFLGDWKADVKSSFIYDWTIDMTPEMAEWKDGIFTKIVVGVETEEELLDIHKKAKEVKILTALIQDCGLTEFGGVPTHTCVAVGPDHEEKINPITGHLKLL